MPIPKTQIKSLLVLLALLPLAGAAHAQRLAVQEVPMTVNHVLYDSGNGKVYASIPGTAALNPNTVAQINAATGAVESHIMVGSNPDVLALSSDGSYLYVGIDGTSSVARIVLASNTVDQQFSLGTSPFGASYPYHAANIVPLPGLPQSVAVTRDYFQTSPANNGVAIYDNGIQRPNSLSRGANIYASLVGSNSPTRLYSYDNESTADTFAQLNVDANGVTVGQYSDSFGTGILEGFNVTIKFDKGNGLVYATNGKVIDPIALTDVGTYSPPASPGSSALNAVDVLPNDQEHQVYFLESATGFSDSPAILQSYSQSSFQQISSFTTPAAYSSLGDLYEISPTRFVFHSSTGVEFAVPQTATSVAVTPVQTTVAVGKIDQFAATATYADGTTGSVTGNATWSSDNTAVATISSGNTSSTGGVAGIAQGITLGTANITATVNGITSRPFALTVTPAHYQVLWNNSDGRASIWNYDADHGVFTQNTYGPYPNWSAKAITQSTTDELTRVLWNKTDGTASLWELDNTAGTFIQDTYGPYPGWTADAVSVGPFNYGMFGYGNGTQNNLLWNNSGSGQSALWDQNFDFFGSFSFYSIGPFNGWSARSIARSPYGQPLVLEDNVDGRMSVLNENNSASYSQLGTNIYGPYPGWTAIALSAGSDTVNALTAHVLWNNTDGRMSLWNYDFYGSFTQNTYGPYPNWSAKAVADGSDGRTLVLWDNTGGAASLWSLDNTTGLFTQHTFGPYPGWTATGVSGN